MAGAKYNQPGHWLCGISERLAKKHPVCAVMGCNAFSEFECHSPFRDQWAITKKCVYHAAIWAAKKRAAFKIDEAVLGDALCCHLFHLKGAE